MSLARIWRLLLVKIVLPPRERSTWSAQTTIYAASGESRSIAKRHYELRLILMILQARKTRLARIWMRFYGRPPNSSHEQLGLVDFVCKRGAGNPPSPPKWGPVGALANTTRTLSPRSNREHEGSTNPVRESVRNRVGDLSWSLHATVHQN